MNPHAISPAQLGRAVRALRVAQRWSQGTLAAKAGLNTDTIVRLEKARSGISQPTIEKIAAVFPALRDLGEEDHVSRRLGMSMSNISDDLAAYTRRIARMAEAIGTWDGADRARRFLLTILHEEQQASDAERALRDATHGSDGPDTRYR